jgi:hypothetical protein
MVSREHAVIGELRDLCVQIESIRKDALELVTPLDDAQFNWRPSPERWSVAQNLAHLNVVDGLDLPAIAKAIEKGRTVGWTGTGPFRYGWLSRWFLRISEKPGKIKMRAPKVYLPPPGEPKEEALEKFVSIHDRMLELAAQSDGLDLARVRVPTPFPHVHFSLGQRFALLAAHDRRHLLQARAVRRHPDFPG